MTDIQRVTREIAEILEADSAAIAPPGAMHMWCMEAQGLVWDFGRGEYVAVEEPVTAGGSNA